MEAVKDDVGGNNPALAQTIARKHSGWYLLVFMRKNCLVFKVHCNIPWNIAIHIILPPMTVIITNPSISMCSVP